MKFFISFFISLNIYANPIHIFHEGNSLEANMLKDILITDYKIPGELITLRKIQYCADVRSRGRIDLCLKNNGDLFAVSVDREFINESLKVFQAP